MPTVPAPPLVGAPPEGDGAAALKIAAQPGASPRVQATALAYFMGEEPPPASDSTFGLDVDFGTLEEPNLQPCRFKPLAVEVLDKCAELAREKKGTPDERLNFHVYRSYVFAYACIEPDLGAALAARRDAGRDASLVDQHKLADTADLVREVFRFQPGVLTKAVEAIEKRSRTGDPEDRSVVEIEAGKTSS